MKTIRIRGARGDSTVVVGESLDRLHSYVPVANTIIITDTAVREIYQHRFPPCRVITIGQGEAVKDLRTMTEIYRRLLDFGADRSTWLVGIGGGIVGDITGFAASTYMRGLRFGNVATTLLSQVDASVGGKNGVNFQGYKNIVGVFNQPAFVVCDLSLLATLPPREISNGLAEIVKHGAIADAAMFEYLEDNVGGALSLDPEVTERLVFDSVRIKAAVVNQDELERGERRKLNFGHTFGHAIEKTAGISHGEAVSLGMMIATAVSEVRGLLDKRDTHRLRRLLQQLALPTRLKGVRADQVWEALQKDKKREGGSIHFVLLERIGSAVVQKLSIPELEAGAACLQDAGNESSARAAQTVTRVKNDRRDSEPDAAGRGNLKQPALYGIFGDPVAHSLSPTMHNKAFAVTGFNGVYLPFRVTSIQQALEALRTLNIQGVSVTLPHKVAVLGHLDGIDETARKIGAVNTILNQGGRLIGYNSDVVGAVAALTERITLAGRRVALVGAGGAARAVGFGILERGGTVLVVNRSQDAGERLAADLGGDFVPLAEIRKIDCDILINTTPVGMAPNVDKSPVPREVLRQSMTVMDIIYTPQQTRLLKDAQAAGCRVINGLPMFVYQGAYQFELWTGMAAPVEAMRKAVLDLI